MERPFFNDSVDKLELEYARAVAQHELSALEQLAHELSFRRTPRAVDLLRTIKQDLARFARATPTSPPSGSTKTRPRSTVGGSTQNQGQRRTGHKPTDEQLASIDAFLTGGSLKINAYAGTGKTSTLEMLAHATQRRGQYIAFNRAIVADAKTKFPSSVNCSTTHGLAYRATKGEYGRVAGKMTGVVNAHKLAELLKITNDWRVDRDHTLTPLSQGSLVLKTVQQFTQSADRSPSEKHVPRHGYLLAASPATITELVDFAVEGAKHIWGRMCDPSDDVPLGHDGYLKYWALSDPRIAADFILLDEAQDTNPAVLEVLRRQDAQLVYVGDRYQQIYEWRGAVNAMERIATDATTRLTKSFRFGSAIADAATQVLHLLNEHTPLTGNPAVKSRLGPTNPDAVLARTNATTITAVIEALDAKRTPHLVGGVAELMEMLSGVKALKEGQPSSVAEFFGFQNWNEVVKFSQSPEGEHLQTFVSLVESRGERQLIWALGQTQSDESKSDLTISTAHKAKGREWPRVRLMDDFLRSRARRDPKTDQQAVAQNGHDPAELRLFYVALTRGREEVEVAPELCSLVGATPRPVGSAGASARGTPSQRQPTSSGTKWKQASVPKTEWKPPKNWTPPASEKPRPPVAPARQAPADPPRKGFFRRIFGG